VEPLSIPTESLPGQPAAAVDLPPGRGRLLQVLGVAFGLAVIIGNTIMIGILRTPGEVAARLPTPGLFLGVWLAGGLYALLGALSLAELGAVIPRSGGQYVLVRRVLGSYPGFIVGWSDWISTSGSVAAGSIVFAEYLPWSAASPSAQRVVACGLVLLLGIVQWRGIRSSDLTQQVLSALKTLFFAVLIATCLLAPAPPAAAPVTQVTVPTGAALGAAIVVALQSVIYTYDGWNGPLYFGGEVKNPGRDIPRAMLGGVLLVTAIYLLLNIALVHLMGVQRMAGDPFVAATAGRMLFGQRGDSVIRLLVIVSIVGGVNACMLMASRVPTALGRDRLLPAAFDRVNRGGTPTVAHLVSVAIALVFILSGTFDAVLALLAFFFVVNYLLSFCSVFVLRWREPELKRPFRAPGYPWSTGLVLLGSVAFLAGSVVSDWSDSWKSLVLLALSYPIYRAIRRNRSADVAGGSTDRD
jgi:basic amino acid/polyamine antiporter, APA family